MDPGGWRGRMRFLEFELLMWLHVGELPIHYHLLELGDRRIDSSEFLPVTRSFIDTEDRGQNVGELHGSVQSLRCIKHDIVHERAWLATALRIGSILRNVVIGNR